MRLGLAVQIEPRELARRDNWSRREAIYADAIAQKDPTVVSRRREYLRRRSVELRQLLEITRGQPVPPPPLADPWKIRTVA